MFNFLKNKLHKIYHHVTTKFNSLFTQKKVDEQIFKELEKILIEADTGIQATKAIIINLTHQFHCGTITEGTTLKHALEEQLLNILGTNNEISSSTIYLLVGINGSGKTTFAGKLAHHTMNDNKKTLLIAADTFRAAATDQLTRWAERTHADIMCGTQNQDPASVVFAGCQRYKTEGYHTLIIDTAGRIQTNINLMKELEKIKRVIIKALPDKRICTLLTIDAMLGQNSLEQARLFHKNMHVDGIVLTKVDGTGKGGIIFAIKKELGIPIIYLSCGEQSDQLVYFDAKNYVHELLSLH